MNEYLRSAEMIVSLGGGVEPLALSSIHSRTKLVQDVKEPQKVGDVVPVWPVHSHSFVGRVG